tara:strand:+ start:80 stop:394 length:315 start_codon:yes stop_codon:yes gene_type:complete
VEKKLFKRLVTRQSKKALLGSLLLITVTACSSLPEPLTGVGNTHYGYASEDPCIRCGESWVILPNQEMAALKHPSNQKPENWKETKFEEMYGPNWREIVPGYND